MLSCLVGCGGCSPTYVARSAYEEGRILLARQSIEGLLAKPELDPETRSKLELVLAIRRFAKDDLKLAVGEAYASFSIVPPGALLRVVSAAERTRLEPYTWWFPIVGDVDYKATELEDAQAEAARLDSEGRYHVRPLSRSARSAGSTIPCCRAGCAGSGASRAADPRAAAPHLVRLGRDRVQRVAGELRRQRGATGVLPRARRSTRDHAARARRLSETLVESRQWSDAVAQLKELYAQRGKPSLDEVLAARAVISRACSRQGEVAMPHQTTPPTSPTRPPRPAVSPSATPGAPTPGAAASASALPVPGRRAPVTLNNAVILANYAYMRDLGAFDRIYRASGEDLTRAITRLREITAGAKDPFAAVVAASPPPADER